MFPYATAVVLLDCLAPPIAQVLIFRRSLSRWEFLLFLGADAENQEHPELTLTKTIVEKLKLFSKFSS
ncbi:hypothetical protein AGOR_G00107230 [Albula goreensis]|uniref:Uncharacterized protein n=1 Tax=Albula goreensis TaxID=1534307 RepID=A0A8T3DEB8_9TELE|nr:hypothetical protein AGOR_G00107230 [Albula goreensis]